MVKFLKSESGDWIGLYINDELVLEGHELDPVDVAAAIIDDDVRVVVKSQEWFEEQAGSCPDEFPKETVRLVVELDVEDAEKTIGYITDVIDEDLLFYGLDAEVRVWEVKKC